MNILLITNIPTPYRIPLFSEISKQCRGQGMTFKVVFAASGYGGRKWEVGLAQAGFDYTVLDSRPFELGDSEKTTFAYRGLLRLIRRERPDIIITNAFSFATMKLWLRSFFVKTPFIIWSGATRNDFEPISRARSLQRRMLVKRAAGFIAYGSLANDYLASLGAPSDRIFIGINTVDTRFFHKKTLELRGMVSAEDRDRKKHLLFVGHLTRRKRPDLLLRAAGEMIKNRSDVVFDIVGDGDERPRLVEICESLGIENSVRFHGFLQKDELPALFARADCFLFPTQFDIWGLVLVEAMAAGVPCIASIRAGATHDLIRDGENGFAADFEDTDAIDSKIKWLLNNPDAAAAMGRNASEFIMRHATIEISAAGFMRAIQNVQSHE